MKFEEIVRLFGNKAWFDFEMVLLISGESDECIHTELYRWRESGKVIELRRGLFTLAEPWRHAGLEAAELAGPIYAPSFLSGAWVLARSGVLPARGDMRAEGLAIAGGTNGYAAGGWNQATVGVRNGRVAGEAACADYTSVTARPAKVFDNVFGRFSYAALPRDLLFGSMTEVVGKSRVRMALPEKALLDFCFVLGGEWDEARFGKSAMDPGQLDLGKLEELAARAGRPRLARAASAFLRYAGYGNRGWKGTQGVNVSGESFSGAGL